MPKEMVGVRISEETKRALEEYGGDGVSKSEAGRRLIERGLQFEKGWLYQPLTQIGSGLAVVTLTSFLLWLTMSLPTAFFVVAIALVTALVNGVAYVGRDRGYI